MGYVYSLDEFRDGKIPSFENFPQAISDLRDFLSELHENGEIHGANIHGSNFHADGSVGSDIDVLVVTEKLEALDNLRRFREDVMNSLYVPIEFVPTTMELAQGGNHHLSSFYVDYMKKYCQEGTVGGSPFELLKPGPDWKNPKKEVRDHLESDLKRLFKSRAVVPRDFSSEHCYLLERLIRQPIYAAIDLLRLITGEFPFPCRRDGKPMTKAECFEALQAKVQVDTSDLQVVMKTRKEYRDFLNKWQLQSSTSYIKLLESIDGMYPNAVRAIETSLDYLQRHL